MHGCKMMGSRKEPAPKTPKDTDAAKARKRKPPIKPKQGAK